MNRGSFWGIDIGGTTAVVGRLSGGSFVRESVIPTGSSRTPSEVIGDVTGAILGADPSPAAIGVGIAGLVDHVRGYLYSSPNLPGWRDCPVGGMMAASSGAPVFVDNDCNVVARGGLATGEISREGLFLVVTLGTGIGGTIVLDGDIAYGNGHAGEFGHMTVQADGPACPCGSSGCWELYAARDALVRYYREAGGEDGTGPRSIASLAGKGDERALSAFDRFGTWAGIGFANLSMCFDPGAIFLAGGLSCNYRLFSGSARSEFGRRCPHRYTVRVVDSPEEAGARGAAHMASGLSG